MRKRIKKASKRRMLNGYWQLLKIRRAPKLSLEKRLKNRLKKKSHHKKRSHHKKKLHHLLLR